MRDQVLEELADADLDSHLVRVEHMAHEMLQEDIAMLLLVLTADKVPHGLVVHVQEGDQVVKDLNGVGFQGINLRHCGVLLFIVDLEVLFGSLHVWRNGLWHIR